MPQRNCVGFQALTVAGTSVSLTVPAGGANYCFIRCETADVRWRDDGTAPTAGAGNSQLLKAGETFQYDGQPEDLKFIRDGSTSGALTISYYSG